MPCFHPLTAYKCASGDIVFSERRRFDVISSLQLPCGQCIGCRLEKSRQWAMRCMHEASLHERNCFLTLTYDDENLPKRGVLEYPTFQKFMKRLRKYAAPVRPRFYMCGEYGPENWRPHYHGCIFGFDFPDKKVWSSTPSGSSLYRSADLERLWPFGFASIGAVTFESAAYVARYCVQKVTGHNAKDHYARVDADGEFSLPPEFNHMSLKPGIGAPWLAKFQTDVYPHDYVVVNGHKSKPPKYYDRLFSRVDPDTMEGIAFSRDTLARSRFEDNTPERLAVKEIVQRARSSMLLRTI